MESSEDKQWASRYLLDPLTAPEPADETGPGAHHTAHGSTASRKPVATSSIRSSTRTSDKDGVITPPDSARSERFPDFDGSYTPNTNRFSSTTNSTQIPTSTTGDASSTTEGDPVATRPRRTSSLAKRFPGDQTHRPLDMLRHSDQRAQRSPHLRKKQHVGADSIDSLDDIAGIPYHHEGPYDAALLARNSDKRSAPLAAVAKGNAEALRATPREKVLDSLQRHYPLDGTAVVPPGDYDREGRYYAYEEGTDMMREGNPEGGAYKRWPHVQYLPNDLKGKGEPAYSLEKALKTHKRNVSEGQSRSYEMKASPTTAHRPRHNSNGASKLGPSDRPGMRHRASSTGAVSASGVSAHRVPEGAEKYVDWERGGSVRRSESGAGAKLRKRMGSLKLKS